MKSFRAYLTLDYQALLVRQPMPSLFRLTTGLRKRPPAPLSGQDGPFKVLVLPRTTAEYQRAGWQQWGLSLLHAVVAELCFAADVADVLLHPLSALREELMRAGPADLPALSRAVSGTTLLAEFAECQALLATDPTRP